MNIETRQISLPSIEQFTLKKLAKQRTINFNLMLSLPYLLKDKQLEDRKDTIAIFRKRKFEPLAKNKHQAPLINNGRIHCIEFWSEKYQGTALKDSHIDSNLRKYRRAIKSNINDYLSMYQIPEQQIDKQANPRSKLKRQLTTKLSGSDEDAIPNINYQDLNISNCTQEDIFNRYRRNNSPALKTERTNIISVRSRNIKEDILDKINGVIVSCNRENRNQAHKSIPDLKMLSKRASQMRIMKKFIINETS